MNYFILFIIFRQYECVRIDLGNSIPLSRSFAENRISDDTFAPIFFSIALAFYFSKLIARKYRLALNHR